MALVIGEHDGDAVSEGKVLPGDGGALSALGRPDRADPGPDFPTSFAFAGGFAVYVMGVDYTYMEV